MTAGTLTAALEREHREIDGDIEEYVAGLAQGNSDATPLRQALHSLRRHIYLEEAFLFPPLKVGGLVMPIFVMLREHGEMWSAMETLEKLLDASADADTLRGACRELLAKLDDHNSKEEPILYPQADILIDAEAARSLHGQIESGTMPEGWRCWPPPRSRFAAASARGWPGWRCSALSPR